MKFILRPVLLSLCLAVSGVAQAAKGPGKPLAASENDVPTFAHNLSPQNEARLRELLGRYEKATGEQIALVRLEKGDAPATLNLISRYDMSDVLSQSQRFVPLYAMMAKAGQPLKLDVSDELKSGVVDSRGRLVALPVLYSTPVMFYNKNAFRKAGLDAEQPPRTWFEMQGVLDKLQEAGYSCPYATSWPVWVHLDNVSAISGAPSASTQGAVSFNALPQVKHVSMMATWSKAGYFRQLGRLDEASQAFREGECAMISTDSREYNDFLDARGVELGVAPLPYHDDVYGGRRPSLADGPSLWVGAGATRSQYKKAAKFVSYVLSPEIQVELVRTYGGLPLTAAARQAVRSKLLSDGNKVLDVAYASLRGSAAAGPVRVANIDPIRLIVDEELEAVWKDNKPAKAALDTAVSRGNAVLGAKPALKKPQPF
jgi:sn-glycerol 3-phosphate transport system substrate-binding protein